MRTTTAPSLPRIRYATASDGARVAFYVLGEGPPLVMLFPYHINHLALNWEVELHRSGIEHLARHFTVVNLDFRGAGLSAGKLHGLSWDVFDADIGSVLDSLAIPGNA